MKYKIRKAKNGKYRIFKGHQLINPEITKEKAQRLAYDLNVKDNEQIEHRLSKQ